MSEVLTAEQLAEKLSIHVDTIRKLTRDGTLPHHRIGLAAVRYTLADVLERTQVNKHPDDLAVDQFAAAMHEKMAAARAKGKEGWDDPDRIKTCELENRAQAALYKAEWVDVANYAMMLHLRGGK